MSPNTTGLHYMPWAFSNFRDKPFWLNRVAFIALILVSSTAFAQDGPSSNSSKEFAGLLTGNSKHASDPSAPNPIAETAIAKTGYEVAEQPHADIWTQVAELRELVNSQEYEIASLRSQLQTPLTQKMAHSGNQWFATYESVIAQPIQNNTTGLIIETDSGYSHIAFPWQMEHSPRVQFGKQSLDDSLGWRVRYWQFRHTEGFVANDANGLIPLGNEATVGYLSEDGDITVGLAFIEEGEFRSKIRTDVIDWEMQRQLADPLNVYAGIRYAKLAQTYVAMTDQGNANSISEFRGIGPTVAMRLQHNLALKQLSLFTELRGSLLFGHKKFSVADDANNLTQSIGDIDLRSFRDGGDTLSSNAEMQIGIRYTPSNWMSLTVAFEAQHFTNVGGPNPTGVFTGPDSGLSGDSPIDDSLSFIGITVGTELLW
ncbi:hypothetical protein CA13_24810 [Planctomycetes bacterium CA13]|uniref:Uncharacterized protein n=1 Tax=Novipirellula herctigrandis TaxID=2527986 RepID=A0A5C5Z144_9BACT|nr:hypothetical protein CA13_24810 [Planctomycetes bacterium CA13]